MARSTVAACKARMWLRSAFDAGSTADTAPAHAHGLYAQLDFKSGGLRKKVSGSCKTSCSRLRSRSSSGMERTWRGVSAASKREWHAGTDIIPCFAWPELRVCDTCIAAVSLARRSSTASNTRSRSWR